MNKSTWQDTLLSKFKNIQKTKKGFKASCPAHDDKNPSLLIDFVATKDGSRARIKCLSGCDWGQILSASGIDKKMLYFSPNNNGGSLQTTTISKKTRAFVDINFDAPHKIYSYTDETGQEIYQNCRFETDRLGNRLEKKTFRQRHKIGEEWSYSLNGLRRVPYNLPKIMQEPYMVADCEGEKDADTLNDLGITATSTNKECFEELSKFCRGKIIIICEDNDEPGRKKAQEKASKYWELGAESVKILRFDFMPEKSDVSDWVKADPNAHDIFTLQEIIADTPTYNPLQSITIDFRTEVTPRNPLIKIDGRNALPSGNIGGIVAAIGQGKSHLTEILVSCAISPGCEPESRIEVFLRQGERVALLDTEQPGSDCKDILNTMHRRTGRNPDNLTDDGNGFRNVSIMSMIHLTHAEKREKLALVLQSHEYKLIAIDGINDFVENPIDPVESINFIMWLHMMAAKYDKGVWGILHGNRNDVSGKGKGWVGDVYQKRATCFLMLRKHKVDPTIRVLTTDFDNVKFRKAGDTDLNIAMQWDGDLGSFRCIPYPEEDQDKLTPERIFIRCFQDDGSLTKKVLTQKYMKVSGKSKTTAYRDIEKSTGVLIKKKNIGGTPKYILVDDF